MWYVDLDEWMDAIVISLSRVSSHLGRGSKNSCLTLLVWLTSLAMFSSVNLSALFCLSRNMREPRLDERLSSSIITSFGTLIFFPRFRPPDRRTQNSQDDFQSYILSSSDFIFQAHTLICCRSLCYVASGSSAS